MMSLITKAHRTDARTRRPPFAATLHSEWLKLTSLPSSFLALGGILAIGLGGSLFLALTLESSGVPSVPSLERTIGDVTIPMVILGQIIAGILGVMSMGAEYSSGAIQSTLLASPKRLRALWAKAIVACGAVTAVALVTVFASWAVTNPVYAEFGLDAPLTSPGVLPALLGAAAYLGLCAVFGVGLGALVRSTTAGAILVFVATLLGPVLTSVLPYSLFSRVLRVMLLGNAGDAMSRVTAEGGPFLDVWGGHISAGAGWLFVSAWAAAALIAGAVALTKRDA
ncbi:ABC transporter permease [Microbacterium caowuchunii]|uniref:ABC transporter permease n=1 Tax=Microbacterium caowuchunii TaxID=2614638 RepID=UPI001243B12E|nr:ABC transporter permease [Microbacterium caowuchunii]QEV98914.1 ABC transporter permease [Microbacterium caowuchunii]